MLYFLGTGIAGYFGLLYICPKIIHKYDMDAKKIQELISGYGLMDTLQDRLELAVVGGVARSTIYKAFQKGPATARTKVVLHVAKELIDEHERAVSTAVLALPLPGNDY